MRGEINRLNEEKGKPEIKPSVNQSEGESKKLHKAYPNGVKSAKLDNVKIIRQKGPPIDRSALPVDAQS